MSEKKIEEYFSPRNNKRPKPSSSPEAESFNSMEQDKVGDMTLGQLMASISESLSNILDTKLSQLASKEDLISLTSQVNRIESENLQLKEEITRLKATERSMAAKLTDLESRSRRNNLIFKGLKVTSQTRDYRALVSDFCAAKFGTNSDLWVNRAHPLGRDRSTVIAHIPMDSDIEYIMSRVKHLKGTEFVVHRDFPQEVRQKRAYLAAVRSEVERVAGGRRMPLVFDHLTVDGQRFFWEGEKLMAGRQDGAEVLRRKYNHDFSGFLTALNNNGPARQHTNLPGIILPPSAVSDGSTDTRPAQEMVIVTPGGDKKAR